MERHRFLAVLLGVFADTVEEAGTLLEVAPTPVVTEILRSRSSGLLVSMDLDPAADGRSVDVAADLCRAPFRTGSVDVAVCFHVFEHIPDDRQAMKELARVLSPKGLGFVQVPWRARAITDEDPSAPPDIRIARFGQADHVRWYGADFEDRLRDSGLAIRRIDPADVMTTMVAERLGIPLDRSPVWIVSPAAGDLAGMTDEDFGRQLGQGSTRYAIAGWTAAGRAEARLLAEKQQRRETEARLAATVQRLNSVEAAHRRIRGQLPVRMLLTVKQLTRRLRRRR